MRTGQAGLVVILSAVILGTVGSSLAGDTSPANDAIKEAISVLEARKAKIEDKAELEKVKTAINMLQQLMREAPGEKVNIPDLIDNTEKYKGKTITLKLKVDTSIHVNDEKSLRDYVGSDVKFHTFGPKREKLSIVIGIPEGTDVPKAVYLDELVITFKCNEGHLQRANTAITIKRP